MNKLFENLKPCTYQYNDKVQGLETEKITIGVIAQDIRKGIEESGENPDDYSIVQKQDTGYFAVDYIQLIPVLIKEINTLKDRLEILENKKAYNDK